MHFYMSIYDDQPGGPPSPEEDATIDDYEVVQARLGLENVVVVQPNAYQADNSCTLDLASRIGPAARAVVVVTQQTSPAELKRMDELGARGARIMDLPGGAVKLPLLPVVARKIAPLGWHPIVQLDGRKLPEARQLLEAVPGNYIIDHCGKFLEPVGTDHEAFQTLLRLLDRGNAYVKLSAPYETSKAGPPDYADVGALARRLAAHAPERVLWASNWPHPSVGPDACPDDAGLLDLLLDWIPTEEGRRLALVDNPLRLYDF
jgi:D-galactarolactone isomerase